MKYAIIAIIATIIAGVACHPMSPVVPHSPLTRPMRFSSDSNSQLFRLIDPPHRDFPPPRFVLQPSYRHRNESITIQYKSFTKSSTLLTMTDWTLSVHVDQHFFPLSHGNGDSAPSNGQALLSPHRPTNGHNDSASLDQMLHAMCHLQFSIQAVSKHVGRNASCRITVRVAASNDPSEPNGSTVASAICSMAIGRSPAICSVAFDLRKLRLEALSSPVWLAVTAELVLQLPAVGGGPGDLGMGDSAAIASVNSAAVLLSNGLEQPRNWTVVQQTEAFGRFAVGLPMTALKVGSSFLLPLSVWEIDELQSLRILLEHDACLALNGVDALDKRRWEVEVSNSYSGSSYGANSSYNDVGGGRADGGREFAAIRIASLRPQRQSAFDDKIRGSR